VTGRQLADWRSGDSRVIGCRFTVPMKTPLARGIRLAVSAPFPVFLWAGGSPLPPFPSTCWKMSPCEAGAGAHMFLRGPPLLS